jgi:hypothetical protein
MPSEVSLAGAVEELRLELCEAHRREAATAKVLQIISRSTVNLREVLDSLIATCGRAVDWCRDGAHLSATAIACDPKRCRMTPPALSVCHSAQSGCTSRPLRPLPSGRFTCMISLFRQMIGSSRLIPQTITKVPGDGDQQLWTSKRSHRSAVTLTATRVPPYTRKP